MTDVFLSPHNDDETLFGSFTLLRHKPLVVVCLRSQVQFDRGYGITSAEREWETGRAMRVLGCRWVQLPVIDREPTRHVADLIEELRRVAPPETTDRVFAPAMEIGGHAHHNLICEIADSIYENVEHYMTYTSEGKSVGRPVPFETDWVYLKTRALSAYRSQSSLADCAEHFLREQHEYAQ